MLDARPSVFWKPQILMGVCMKKPTDPFAALDRSIEREAERVQLESRIYGRVRYLMKENGLEYSYTEEEALNQAVFEAGASGFRPR